MQSLQAILKLIPRILAATMAAARSTLADAAAKHRDRRILERLSAAELEDIGLCRGADGAIDFQPRCPDESEPKGGGIETLYGSPAMATAIEKA
ncbi:MAG: DUF1127 domain-containing protein [Mesorhizobium sp.]|uniref:DUF1127 domain-containing protein n=1 Tax=unclassified Mesorhizobium TaxID=325217 RepID=UPI000F753C34|nr:MULTISPECIES: DUF1127 domain-containing protein [unclassified Mesorhizobium]AZO69878.1 DUF1127 domain-containing protein [Mesorhizobium sp. M1D.F.Ca.ET.043.01.1.1]RWA88366.1 MAG: DUF1127 domain-containing protein [Mesorhizobium sp.]RWE16435.1 MAG: DUF1127 domain-containing protein [Mesorhizobium sp.]TIV97452.1 MAG: DUF1127 domain-containing protein [Mesorhizobium sp.]TJW87263.1 MAG: DUF1127 domain-containing protein [Mesorhizobium sp.]